MVGTIPAGSTGSSLSIKALNIIQTLPVNKVEPSSTLTGQSGCKTSQARNVLLLPELAGTPRSLPASCSHKENGRGGCTAPDQGAVSGAGPGGVGLGGVGVGGAGPGGVGVGGLGPGGAGAGGVGVGGAGPGGAGVGGAGAVRFRAA